jgi:hypothetical protein
MAQLMKMGSKVQKLLSAKDRLFAAKDGKAPKQTPEE